MLPAWALVKRELLGTLRRGVPFLIVALTLAVCSLLVWTSWPAEMKVGLPSDTAENIFFGLSLLLGAVGLLTMPALAVGLMTSEHDADTLTMLRMTLVRPSWIAAAKVVAAVGVFALLIGALTPILSVVLFGTGIETHQPTTRVISLLLAAAVAAAIGVACAAGKRFSLSVLATAYGLTLLYQVLPNVTAVALHLFGRALKSLFSFDSFINTPQGASGDGPSMRFLAATVLCSTGVIGYCIWIAGRRLSKAQEEIDGSQLLLEDITIANTVHGIRPKPCSIGWRCIYQRERYIDRIQNSVSFIGLAVGFLLAAPLSITVLGAFTGGLAASEAASAPFFLLPTMMLIIMPILTAPSFSRERERDTLRALEMTLLKPREVVLGKVAAAVIRTMPAAAGALLSFIPLLIGVVCDLEFRGLLILFVGSLTTASAAALGIAASIYASVLCRRTGAALVIAYEILIALCVPLPVLAIVGARFCLPGKFAEEIVFWSVGLFSPPLGYLLPAAAISHKVGFGDAFGCWFVSLISSGILTVFLLWWATRILARERERNV